MVSREICKICFHENSVGFDVPDEVWKEAVPPEYQQKVLCLNCFTRLADMKLVRWDARISFFPVSLYTHLESIYEV